MANAGIGRCSAFASFAANPLRAQRFRAGPDDSLHKPARAIRGAAQEGQRYALLASLHDFGDGDTHHAESKRACESPVQNGRQQRVKVGTLCGVVGAKRCGLRTESVEPLREVAWGDRKWKVHQRR